MKCLLDDLDYIRPNELAIWLGFTEAYIYKLRKNGVLTFTIIDGINYISTKDVKNWIFSNMTSAQY